MATYGTGDNQVAGRKKTLLVPLVRHARGMSARYAVRNRRCLIESWRHLRLVADRLFSLIRHTVLHWSFLEYTIQVWRKFSKFISTA